MSATNHNSSNSNSNTNLRTDRAATSVSLMVWREVALALTHAPESSLTVNSAAHTCPAHPPPFRLA
eukprot:914792-Rhodomonas_salina.1